MSIVAVHGPVTWADSEDQGNDRIAMQELAGVGTGVANNATTTSTATSAQAGSGSATGEALRPTRVTTY